MAHRPRQLAAMLATTLLLAGCADDEPDRIGADVDQAETTEPDEPTEPEEPADPFAIPDEIDEEYTQRVLDELLPMLDRAERAAVEAAPAPMVPEETLEVFRATYSPAVSVSLLATLNAATSSEDSAAELQEELEEYGEVRWVVTELGEPTADCVPFRFDYEFTAKEVDQTGLGVLTQAAGDRDPAGHNPTPWVIGRNGVEDRLDEDLDSICAASAENDEEILREQDEADQEESEVETR
jgi:hypothetical protein